MALPLMSRYSVPATPENYAVWYRYVSGESEPLKEEIDGLIAREEPFDSSLCSDLYRRFVVTSDLDNIEQVRAGLGKVLSDVDGTLAKAGDETGAYGHTLGDLVSTVSDDCSLQEVRGLLQTLLTETRTIQASTHEMQEHFEAKTREIEDLQEQLQAERRRAITDPLTGLSNRMALMEQLNAAAAEMVDGDPPSIVMLDIDHFKKVNDTHGHLIGDRVIRHVAQVLLKNIKGRDTAARYGGEEFTLLLPSTATSGAMAVAESIRKTIAAAQLVRSDNKKPIGQVTISAGVATYRPGEDMTELLSRADQALYEAKNSGRNRVCAGAEG